MGCGQSTAKDEVTAGEVNNAAQATVVVDAGALSPTSAAPLAVATAPIMIPRAGQKRKFGDQFILGPKVIYCYV